MLFPFMLFKLSLKYVFCKAPLSVDGALVRAAAPLLQTPATSLTLRDNTGPGGKDQQDEATDRRGLRFLH